MERPKQPEFNEVVKYVFELVLGELAGRTPLGMGLQTPEERERIWQEAANKFKRFSEKIMELREALKIAETIRREHPQWYDRAVLYFSGVEDLGAKEILTDLLLARISDPSGRIGSFKNMFREAKNMVRELGMEGLTDEKMKNVDLKKVVEAVLSGKLKLTRPTR